ncbi:PREDICTED: pentatricopeptide repeat-containing protein At2g48000 isoform X2 [Tarenaya hassleriana]|uniref:pentatricopeptide repeat-containing protein At2g48000 isoform X2 n=1 Tax=Tarenaya hassleriana TaxID=28532 RepID=UPI00053C55DE|nr:PREDICTED: pentatricopeptide repeat-containing protein At2g48000 isoform X2 [Tarenaya hassleriana]
MKRIWRISQIPLFSDHFRLSRGSSSTFRTLTPFCFTLFRSPKHPPFPRELRSQIRTHRLRSIFTGKSRVRAMAPPRDDMPRKASVLKDELLQNYHPDKVTMVLDKNERFLLHSYREGAAVIELLRQLRPWPVLALEVFNWRRNKAECGGKALTADEYAQGITISGRVKDLDMAVELFDEAAKKQIKTTYIYNALMGAYMWSGLTEKCNKLFGELKKQHCCSPSVSTYNILISAYGRWMMVDRMEAVFKELKELKIPPDMSTYNNLIAEYIRAWKWDKVEATFKMMKNGPVKPNIGTYLLMLRGYANSGNLSRMEETYESVKHYVNRKEIPLIESMICAYSRNADKDKMYAQEDNLEAMEDFINEAFEKEVQIETIGIMRSVVASYFRSNAVDKLAGFVQRAQSSGWRMCRSVYHGLMIMYGSHKRLSEMENTLYEMDNFNIRRIKKTFCILHRVYTVHGQKYKIDQVAGMMLKHGHGFPQPYNTFDIGGIEAI